MFIIMTKVVYSWMSSTISQLLLFALVETASDRLNVCRIHVCPFTKRINHCGFFKMVLFSLLLEMKPQCTNNWVGWNDGQIEKRLTESSVVGENVVGVFLEVFATVRLFAWFVMSLDLVCNFRIPFIVYPWQWYTIYGYPLPCPVVMTPVRRMGEVEGSSPSPKSSKLVYVRY